jgi:hypothetical protein
MTCLECRDLMLEVSRHRAAPFVDRRVLAHVAECEACGRHLERERALTTALGRVAREAAGQGASPDVESRVMAAFAAQAPAVNATASSGAAARWLLPAAAALLLAAGGTAWWRPAPEEVVAPVPGPVGVTAAAPQRSAPLSPGGAAVVPPPGDRPAVRHRRPVNRPAPGPAAAARAEAIEAVGFVPLPSAAGLPPFESGEIVRLGIPVTALPNYGVDIPAGGQASVEADLLIGQDGQARAIRLVTVAADGTRPRQ